MPIDISPSTPTNQGDRVAGLVADTLLSARLGSEGGAPFTVAEAWMHQLQPPVTFEHVGDIDIDAWSQTPALAVLGDAMLVIVDAQSGRERSRHAVDRARHAKWIGPGWLMVLEPVRQAGDARTRIRVLDIVSGRWTEPVMTGDVTRLAVRGDEIHVGYSNQSIAVWDRAEVCRAIGAFACASPGPREHGTGAPPLTPRHDVARLALP